MEGNWGEGSEFVYFVYVVCYFVYTFEWFVYLIFFILKGHYLTKGVFIIIHVRMNFIW